MAKGLIQTAHWRSTTLIVSETRADSRRRRRERAFHASAGSRGRWCVADTLPKALVITSVCQLCLYYGDLYDDPHAGGSRTELFIRTLQALGITLLILAALYTMFPALIVARGVLAPAATLAVTALIGWRLGFALGGAAGRSARAAAARRHRLGGARRWRASCTTHEEDGVQIVGFVDTDATSHVSAGPLAVPRRRSTTSRRSCARASVDRVVVSLADARGKLPMDKLLEMKLDGVALRLPRVGLRGVHRQDRGREPASELADFLGRVPQDARAARGQARDRHRRRRASGCC